MVHPLACHSSMGMLLDIGWRAGDAGQQAVAHGLMSPLGVHWCGCVSEKGVYLACFASDAQAEHNLADQQSPGWLDSWRCEQGHLQSIRDVSTDTLTGRFADYC